jgi:acid phosphatase (class A)
MQNRFRSAAATLILAALLIGAAPKTHFLAPGDVDWKPLLKGPPALGSDQAKADLDTVLDWQQKRTGEDVKRCKAEESLSPDAFADILGDKFDLKKLPVTAKLLKDVASDTIAIAGPVKDQFARPRPPKFDSRVKPCVHIETSGSYPSSHAARGVVWASVLAQLYPDQKEKLIARGKQIGDDRFIAGIHFPTDVEAGQTLGNLVFEKLVTNEKFKASLAAAKAEIDAAK